MILPQVHLQKAWKSQVTALSPNSTAPGSSNSPNAAAAEASSLQKEMIIHCSPQEQEPGPPRRGGVQFPTPIMEWHGRSKAATHTGPEAPRAALRSPGKAALAALHSVRGGRCLYCGDGAVPRTDLSFNAILRNQIGR